ncbi:MAG: ABC transporter ATP-binding protein [Lachnospiraceae bacterium]|nr:ABC transporter ATP-binding protein [Lachnospiraceae bacterium]
MIEINALTKKLDGRTILEGISTHIEEGTICGLVGSNGAGKSTLLRCVSGVYHPEEGEVRIAGSRPDLSEEAREKLFFLADEAWFPEGSSAKSMAAFYASYYPSFSTECFEKLCKGMQLDPKKRLSSFSKGMRRQAAMVLALSARTPCLLLDESFDGLDPIARKALRQFLCAEAAEHGITVLISSHSLRELQDLCDQLLFLHRGQILLDQKTDDVKSSLLKLQVAFADEYDRSSFEGFEIVQFEKNGKVANLIVRGSEEHIREQLAKKNPVLLEIMPLTLEETFTCEAEALGYSFDLTEAENNE